MVAAGEADLLATLRWGFEWDIAAAALIAEEAGATVSGALGQPLAFNTASGEAFGVLVATPGIHARRGRAPARARHGGGLIRNAVRRTGFAFPPGLAYPRRTQRYGEERCGALLPGCWPD